MSFSDRQLRALRRSLDKLGNRYPVLLDEGDVERVCREALAD